MNISPSPPENKLVLLFRALVLHFFIIALASCSSGDRIDSEEFYRSFPRLTASTFYSKTSALTAVKDKHCATLSPHSVRTNSNASAITKMRNNASQVDGIVIADGGNGYQINHFEWEQELDSTEQLLIEFSTMLCEA
ncbi:MAG: hypothetical protein COC19_06845 [SAR86 cluster bacterium]|uniref:Uncharacterized protein n=1 Tax=SAR86 cluster bacterium TaxID=2030880 RepID=A0A2A4MIA7_9GAMM|nr:MAG: hypothetical protein COC19_06845 [SAR86 cluster bacterium]